MAAHVVLLVLRQYERKSYRMFVDWLVEAYYLRTFMGLSHTHTTLYTTLQKFASRITKTVLEKIIYSFILLHSNIIRRLFIGIDSSGFKITNASQYYTDKANLRKKYLKLSVSADICYFN
jgi:hypothetical protein